jgi:hypothetical protein
MNIQIHSTYVEYLDSNNKLIERISYSELGINIDSRLCWNENILINLIKKRAKNFKSKSQQLSLFE